MEANFFRFLAAELGPELTGRRIDKVYGPAPNVWTIKLQNRGAPLHMLFRPAKSAGHLFLSPVKPVNPDTATAMSMWFRKRLRNRLILAVHVNWPELSIALELSPRNDPPCGSFLVLDCRTGMELVDALPDGFEVRPEWPTVEDATTDPEVWRDYPHISPPLRKALAQRTAEEAHALYFMVASGSAADFYMSQTDDEWNPPLAWQSQPDDDHFTSALEAANAYGERTLFPLLEMEEEKPEQVQLKRAKKKIKRNLARLEEEEARLRELASEQVKAEALQAELYKYRNSVGLEEVTVTHPEHGTMTVALNPHITPTENMEKYFKVSAKAQRGFPHIERRRDELLRQMARLDEGVVPEARSREPEQTAPEGVPPLPKRYKGLAVSVFRSSDGFTIIRGKNKKANHDILSKAASPFDYWFHVADGPSSHIILKRDHPGHEVPDTTLTEAAVLCGLKSYRSEDTRADVMYALVKDVRKVKGYAHGQVAVDKRIATLRVDLDPQLEERLK